MAITEIALLHLRSGLLLSPTSSSNQPSTLAANLLKVKNAQEGFSQYPVHFFSQVEDPSYVYILGGWDSVAEHVHDWIPSSTNRELLEILKDDVEVQWMFHVDIDPRQLDPKDLTATSAPTIAIGRYFVKDGERGSFQATFDATSRHLANFSSPRPFQGGWRIDKERAEAGSGEQQEFVLFTRWDDVAHHICFAESDGFKEFAKIKDSMDGAEIKHAVKLVL